MATIHSNTPAGPQCGSGFLSLEQGFPYSGWISKGRRAEAGSLNLKYKVTEMPTTGYHSRTKRNIIDSDGTVIFTHGPLTGGSSLTRKLAQEQGRPWLHINLNQCSVDGAVKEAMIRSNDVEILNVAGRPASKDLEIYDKVFQIISGFINASIFN